MKKRGITKAIRRNIIKKILIFNSPLINVGEALKLFSFFILYRERKQHISNKYKTFILKKSFF
ncbi:MAG: hypothetical protein D6734_04715 [Candidatus Schekmanbacteria bacterium]|nr:MAG: hypothetical protein D6734_04715 [Candidatus Schekmanbacteria bacterium]